MVRCLEQHDCPGAWCMEEFGGLYPDVCRSPVMRWGYNQRTKKCQRFSYGGCHENNNNFETEKQCQNVCTICGGKCL